MQSSNALTRPDEEEYDVPPPYEGRRNSIDNETDRLVTKASPTQDGRVDIRLNQRDRNLSLLLGRVVHQLDDLTRDEHPSPPSWTPPSPGAEPRAGTPLPPAMNIVIQIVGSRGDVQPFIALAKVLRLRFGHRVRLATHPNFKDFVQSHDIEFFSIGGDPHGLMAFMVKNPGLMPGFDSLRSGDVGKRRREVAEYLEGCWRSCFQAGDGISPQMDDDDLSQKPFVADCIIANPPSFAHAHIAERLGIPVHIFFTMPYSPTQAFPHPLANIQQSDLDENLSNYMSYILVDMLTWQGLGDVINRFRKASLGLEETSAMRAPTMLQRLKIPHTYAWSPALIQKPRDWGSAVDIAGFFFLDQGKDYTPPPELKAFLDSGPPPIYIGFGSIVLEDPDKMTALIFDAIRKTGQRALVSKGWGGMGGPDRIDKPDNVFMLGNVPHEWLFKHVSCVVHHGGAGTTSAGLAAGRPTVIVPFFGDQAFWGSVVTKAGAGPDYIHSKSLTADKLANAILQCLEPQMQIQAQALATSIAKENGTGVGVGSFHRSLDLEKMRCSFAPSRAAVWQIKGTSVRLSAMAAHVLAQDKLLDFNHLELFRACEFEIDEGAWDPFSGGAAAVVGTFVSMATGLASMPKESLKAVQLPRRAQKIGSVGSNQIDTASADVPHSGRDSDHRRSQGRILSSELATTGRDSRDSGSDKSAAMTGQSPSNAFDTDHSSSKTDRAGREQEMYSIHGQGVSTPQPGLGGHSEISTTHPSPNTSRSLQAAVGTGKGLGRVVGAMVKAPMDFSFNMAKGFHNAPQLYGDDTVRKSDKVTGFRSGLTIAGKEFGYGMYDGITGLVTQPVRGAGKEGGLGALKGFGKGIGGLFFKPGAALFALPAYAMKGLHKQVQKYFGSGAESYIVTARLKQGFDEYQSASSEERRDVLLRWKDVEQRRLRGKPRERVRGEPEEGMSSTRKIKREGRSQTQKSESSDPEDAMLAMGGPSGRATR